MRYVLNGSTNAYIARNKVSNKTKVELERLNTFVNYFKDIKVGNVLSLSIDS
jgi:hypothetical protein